MRAGWEGGGIEFREGGVGGEVDLTMRAAFTCVMSATQATAVKELF